MTNWYDNIVNGITNAIETVYAKKTDLSDKADKVNGANQITDTTSNFSNLGTLSNMKQSTINTAIDGKIGSIENEIGDIHTLIYGTGGE